MRELVIAVTLGVLFGYSVAQPTSTPSADGESYNFKYRDPANCVYGTETCRYFVGIQRNVDDSDYLDFIMEGEANGWVAVGFSLTASMFDADVLGCVVIGTDAAAVDTWNVASPGRNNVLDATQDDVIEHAASFTNGRISCSFSRLIAVTDEGQDLNLLDENYWLLYGVGQNVITTGILPRALNVHLPQGNPTISDARVDLGITLPPPSDPSVPTNPPEDYPFTYRAPEGCTVDGGDCDYFLGIQENEANPDYLDFYLEGVAVAWVAVGFSTTADMFDADVLGCIRFEDSITAVDGWNVGQSTGRINILDVTQNDVVQHSSSYNGDRISCLFSRRAVGDNIAAGTDLDLSLPGANYYLLYGTGLRPITASGQPFNFHGFGNTPAISAVREEYIEEPIPPPPPPLVGFERSTPYTVFESSGTVMVTIIASDVIERAVQVRLYTEDITATAPSDYTAVDTTVVLMAGSSSWSVPITITDDDFIEPNERFAVILETSDTGVELGNRRVKVVIKTDDDCPTYMAEPSEKMLLTSDPHLIRCTNICGKYLRRRVCPNYKH